MGRADGYARAIGELTQCDTGPAGLGYRINQLECLINAGRLSSALHSSYSNLFSFICKIFAMFALRASAVNPFRTTTAIAE
jgi:hypothetical protein